MRILFRIVYISVNVKQLNQSQMQLRNAFDWLPAGAK